MLGHATRTNLICYAHAAYVYNCALQTYSLVLWSL